MPRLADPDPETLTPEQKAIFEDIAAGPRGGVRGPFKVLIHSPGLCDRVQKLGAFVRYDCSVPQKLREMAILITARHMSAEYEWHAHETHALNAGLAAAIIEAIRAGEQPQFTEPEEEVVYDFVTELHRTHRVGDAAYQAALSELGQECVVDLVGLLGHYSLVAMTLNTFEVPVPDGKPSPFAG